MPTRRQQIKVINMATLYFHYDAVARHGSVPPDGLPTNPMLFIGSIPSGIRKYNTVQEDGNLNDGNPTADFLEYAITFATFVRPESFFSDLNWRSISVPDNFVIPDGIRNYVSENIIHASIDSLKGWAETNGYPTIKAFLDTAEQVIKIKSLHDVLAAHMRSQFDIIDKGLNGQISPQEMLQLSDAAASKLIQDLLVEAGAPQLAVDLLFKGLGYVWQEPSFVGFLLPDGTFLDPSRGIVIPQGTGGLNYKGSGGFVGGAFADTIHMDTGN